MDQLVNQFDSTPKNNRTLLLVITSAVLTAVITGSGIYWWANQKQTELNNEIVSLRIQIDRLKQIPAPTPTLPPTSTSSADKQNVNLDIKELAVRISYPRGCHAQKSDEENRAGSHISYNFNCALGSGSLTLQEISLYTKSSIQKFEQDCRDDTPCFFGYTPSSSDYSIQKDALLASILPVGFELKSINNERFLVKYIGGPYGGFRMYVTYIGDIRIESRMFLNDKQPSEALNKLSDDEFSKFQFSSLQ